LLRSLQVVSDYATELQPLAQVVLLVTTVFYGVQEDKQAQQR